MKNLNMVRNTVPPSRKGIPHSEETKQRMREVAKAKGFGKWMKGKTASLESNLLKSKNSAKYWLGKKRPSFSKETRSKMGESHIGHKVSVKTLEHIKQLSKGKFGKDHPCWKEDKKHPLHKAIRKLYKYVEWRTFIFTRDNFTCVLCNATKCYIEADHYPVRFADILKDKSIKSIEEALNCVELWDTDNGRVLCKPCHLKHTFVKA